MSEPKFTPGPWKIGAYESGRMAVDGANDEEVTGWIDPEDACLIAAAPELYEALELALPHLLKDTSSHGLANYWNAKNALTKARGES